jgi:predicted kinase
MLTVITGPPCSGKSTYVTQHAQPGDITIDYDTLACALGAPTQHEYPHHVREVTFAARDAAIRQAIIQHQQGARVWIIDTQPGKTRRRQYHIARAHIIALTATRDELHARAAACGRPARIHALIDHLTGMGTGETVHAVISTSRAW